MLSCSDPSGSDSSSAELAAAVRGAARTLARSVRTAPSEVGLDLQIGLLSRVATLLDVIAGALECSERPEAGRARWQDAAGLAADVTDSALAAAAAGLSLDAAAGWLRGGGSGRPDVTQVASAVVELFPPDHPDTSRPVTVTVYADPRRAPKLSADDPAPCPRQNAATLLQTDHLLARLGALLGGMVLGAADGRPLHGSPDADVRCEFCNDIVGGDVARVVDVGDREVQVCTPGCARAVVWAETMYEARRRSPDTEMARFMLGSGFVSVWPPEEPLQAHSRFDYDALLRNIEIGRQLGLRMRRETD